MAHRWLFNFALVVFLLTLAVHGQVKFGPWRCPTPEMRTECSYIPPTCSRDVECPGVEKCCKDECDNRMCAYAINEEIENEMGSGIWEKKPENGVHKPKVTVQDPTPTVILVTKKLQDPTPTVILATKKPGKCPKRYRVECSGAPSSTCSLDAECPGVQKCCDDGCGGLKCSEAVQDPTPTVILATKKLSQKPLEKCQKMDAIFVLDRSSSIRRRDYDLMRAFLITLGRRLRIGERNSKGEIIGQGAIVTFSEKGRKRITLTQSQRPGRFESIVKSMPGPLNGGRTKTHRGLAVADKQVVTKAAGFREDDPDVCKMFMVITDGKQTRESRRRGYKYVKEAMQPFFRRDLDVFAVGVGLRQQSAIKQVRDMVKDPKNAILPRNFKELSETIGDFMKKFSPAPLYASDGPMHSTPSVQDSTVILARRKQAHKKTPKGLEDHSQDLTKMERMLQKLLGTSSVSKTKKKMANGGI